MLLKAIIFLSFWIVPAQAASLQAAYLGVQQLTPNSWVLDLCPQAVGKSAMPITLSSRVILPVGPRLDPAIFQVKTNLGAITPICATLSPAYGREKNLTILLTGDFESLPQQKADSVEIVGDLRLEDGSNARGLTTPVTAPTPNRGGSLLQARLWYPKDLSNNGDCPAKTTHVAMLVFDSGAHGFMGAPYGSQQLSGTFARGTANGKSFSITPVALGGDGDKDNFANACFVFPVGTDLTSVSISVSQGAYFDPVNRPGLASQSLLTWDPSY